MDDGARSPVGSIRIGPAGWDYKDWTGIVYPAPKPKGFDALRFLAGFFDTVEINSTFYRPVPSKVTEAWVERVEGNRRFRFAVKLWRRFTHERGSPWTAEEVRLAREPLEALEAKGRLGAVLLQFPWSFRNDEPAREWLGDLFRELAGLPLVLEIRHESWNTPELLEELTERGVGFVNIDQPLFRHSLRPSAVATAAIGYVRIHGRNYRDWFRKGAGRDARYDYLYTAQELEPWAARVGDIAAQPGTKETYVVTNNHHLGKAPANALMLRAMLTGEKPECPEPLFERYRDALEAYARPVECSRLR